MKYKNFLERVSSSFQARVNEIITEWNFDQGNEFETVVGLILREMLPEKYGICRGFVTPEDGDPKGDDLIIYDRLSAPLLRPTNGFEFTRKEYVPVESVYAYIEVKKTIQISEKSSGNSLAKAIKQVREVKEIARKTRALNEIVDNINTSDKF